MPNNTKYITKQIIHPGYNIGAIAEAKLIDRLYIQPGAQLSWRGSGYTVGNTSGGSSAGFPDFRFSAYYADISANLLYKFDIQSDKIFVFAGPQAGYGLSGKWKTSDGVTSDVRFGKDPTDDFRSLDYGVNVGAGFEKGRIQVSAQYYQGLATLSTAEPPLDEQKYKALNISFAYLFGGKARRSKMNSECKYVYKIRKYKTYR